MSFVDFLGFVITFGAMIVLFARKAKQERRRRADPVGWEKKQQKKKQELEKLYSVILEGKPKAPKRFEEPYEEEEEEELFLPPVEKPVKVEKKTSTRKLRIPKKEMVILATLFGSPKSLK